MENILIPEDRLNPESNSETNLTPLKPKKTKIYIIPIVFFTAILAFVLNFFIQKPKLIKTSPEIVLTEKKSEVQLGWTKYRNDILGIEFQYPQRWGNITLSPYENITDLKTINKEFLNTTNNNFRDMVEIRFSNNNWIDFDFINDQYPGENYPNGFAEKYGPMDNFQKLIITKNICDYHFSFKNDVDGRNVTYLESDDKCEDNIKTTLFFENPDATNQSGNRYFNYQIKQYFYKKLNNAYFDNLLISNYLVSYQGSESDLNSNQIIAKSKPEIPYDLSSSNFKEFVESIKTFTPSTPTPIIFSEKSGEDKNITTIRKYYFYLATRKLQDAYEMYLTKNITFDEFTKWYGLVFNTNVYNIKQIKANTYVFDVDISEQNKKEVAKYRIRMEIINNKINILSSEQITSKEVSFASLTAYTRIKSNKNEIVLIKDGQEIIIDSGDNDWQNKMATTRNFSDPKFSPQGNYLTYFLGGWEYSGGRVYDIKNSHILTNISIPFPTFIEISNNEKYIVGCYESGMSGEYGAFVSSFPEYKVQYDFFKNSNFNVTRKCILTNGFEETYMCDRYECKVTGDIAEFSVKSQEFVRSEDKINLLLKFNLTTGQVIQ